MKIGGLNSRKHLSAKEVSCVSMLMLYTAWLISLAKGLPHHFPGYIDWFGHPLGADFVQFYAAGKSIILGNSSQLYDRAAQHFLQEQIVGAPFDGGYNFNYPPIVALFFTLFAALPYPFSFTIWTTLQILALYLSIRVFFCRPLWPAIHMLGWFPVFATISYGQNGLISMAILSTAAYLIRKDQSFGAGCCVGLLCFKPQLLVGLVTMWLLTPKKSYKILSGTVMIAFTLLAIQFLFLSEASTAYQKLLFGTLRSIESESAFPFEKAYSAKVFFLLMLRPSEWINPLWICSGILVVLLSRYAVYKLKASELNIFAFGILLTPWITPYIMVYDLCILVVGIFILMDRVPQAGHQLFRLCGVVWAAMTLNVLAWAYGWFPLQYSGQFAILFAMAFLLLSPLCTDWYEEMLVTDKPRVD